MTQQVNSTSPGQRLCYRIIGQEWSKKDSNKILLVNSFSPPSIHHMPTSLLGIIFVWYFIQTNHENHQSFFLIFYKTLLT